MEGLRVMRNLLLVLLLCSTMKAAVGAGVGAKFDSIYQFGDSLSDTGNLKIESKTSPCSLPPYGETLSSKPNGRCSDGLLMIDYFAKTFGLPLLNPYLQKDANFTQGVNFAVAGATALRGTNYPNAVTNSSLDVQLEWFKTHLDSICHNSSSSECKAKFKNTLFMMGEVGGNDYNYALAANPNIETALGLVPQVVQAIVSAVNEVIARGALQVVVPGNFPIGCMPAYLNVFRSNDSNMYDNLGCLRQPNQFARLHNDNLKRAIQDLQRQHPDVAIHYADYYSTLQWVLRNAQSLGFEKDAALKPCCGEANADHFCGMPGAGVCDKPKERINWDGVHLTQRAYGYMARRLLSNIFPAPTPAPTPAPAPAPTSSSHTSGANALSIPIVLSLAVLVLGLKLA